MLVHTVTLLPTRTFSHFTMTLLYFMKLDKAGTDLGDHTGRLVHSFNVL